MIKINENVLSNDLSPILRQHKDNPVNWQTWSKETLEFAKKIKNLFCLALDMQVAIGVMLWLMKVLKIMKQQKLMNKLFINIKVDREERPDLDFIFQSSFQLFNQTGGGWPLTMFLDENGVPFMGGTYFPKESKHGLPSFKEVLQKFLMLIKIKEKK